MPAQGVALCFIRVGIPRLYCVGIDDDLYLPHVDRALWIACSFLIEVLETFLSLLVPPYSDHRYFEVEKAYMKSFATLRRNNTPRPLIYIPSFSFLVLPFSFAGAAGSPN